MYEFDESATHGAAHKHGHEEEPSGVTFIGEAGNIPPEIKEAILASIKDRPQEIESFENEQAALSCVYLPAEEQYAVGMLHREYTSPVGNSIVFGYYDTEGEARAEFERVRAQLEADSFPEVLWDYSKGDLCDEADRDMPGWRECKRTRAETLDASDITPDADGLSSVLAKTLGTVMKMEEDIRSAQAFTDKCRELIITVPDEVSQRTLQTSLEALAHRFSHVRFIQKGS